MCMVSLEVNNFLILGDLNLTKENRVLKFAPFFSPWKGFSMKTEINLDKFCCVSRMILLLEIERDEIGEAIYYLLNDIFFLIK